MAQYVLDAIAPHPDIQGSFGGYADSPGCRQADESAQLPINPPLRGMLGFLAVANLLFRSIPMMGPLCGLGKQQERI